MFAEAGYVIQIEWQGLASAAVAIGGSIVGAGKIVALQLSRNADSIQKRHLENREDAKEARDENRVLSQAILKVQAETVKSLTEMQGEIRAVLVELHAYTHLPPTKKGPDSGSKERRHGAS